MRQLSVGVRVTIGETTLIPLERVTITTLKPRPGYWLGATKEIVAVVISRPDGLRALDMEGRERTIDELNQEFPELATVIRECPPD